MIASASIHHICQSLQRHLLQNATYGFDPFDGLNSRLFQALPFIRNSPMCRLAWLQLFKRSPIDFRKLTLVPPHRNPKGVALCLSGLCLRHSPEQIETIKSLANTLLEIRQQSYSGACWGYPFDWQARAFFQPKGTPTVVATTYCGYALLDAFDLLQDAELLDTARSACEFVLNDLHRTIDGDGDFAFSYSPLDQTQVFNASLLGARLLSRVYSYTKEQHLIEAARRSVAFVCKHQRPDGAWPYSLLPYHQWVDSFHTGFNLECIYEYQKHSDDHQYQDFIKNGLNYYLNNFFTPEGIPKYYDNQVYPIDMHAPAQLVVTLHRLDQLENHAPLVDKVMDWCVTNMFDKNRGYFYYQKSRWFTNKIPYLRWTQAWMWYALSILDRSIYSKTLSS